MNNNPVSYIDPDGRNPIAIGVFIGAAVLGGGGNLWSNWGKVKNFKQGAAYFASGAVGGAVSVVNPALGGSITAGGNLATDFATGNMPSFRGAENPAWEIAKYTGGLALDGFGAAGAGSLSNWTFNGGLKNSFGWVQSPYFKPTAGWTTIKNPTTGVLEKISWAAETGVKATRVPLTNFAAQAGKQGISFADDAGQKLLPQFSQSTIDEAASLTMKLKESHIFDGKLHPKPYLNDLATQLNGRNNLVKQALENANGRFPTSGVFEIPVNVGGQNLTIRGFINNNKPILNTIFDPLKGIIKR